MEDTIIVASLEKKELEKSIQELVDYVGNKTNDMADKFTEGIDKMKLAMKDFAITQKVSVDVMKEAWRNMSSSFDAMVAAQSTATGSSRGGGGGGKPQYPDNTVGSLEEIIRLEEKRRKEMELGSDELRNQNRLLEELKNTRKSETTSKKTLKDVLGMDENSVEAVAKKMRELKRIQIDPNNTQQVKLLGDEYQRLSRRQSELLGKNAQVTRSNNYLAQSFGYIRNRLVYALTLGAISNFTKELFQIRGQYELMERSLGVLLDDMGKGSQIFRELNAMSLKSPFTLIDLAGAAKQLTAYNFAADEVVDTTRRLADISSALGVPMERLVYNLGQIRAQNVLNARDARDFANAGLPIVSMLADMYTEQKRFGDGVVTTANVYDMMSKKMVSYADVMQVINKVTDEGGKFFDFQAKQADTLQVQIANLNLAYNNMLNSIGKENQGVLAGSLSILKNLLLNWRQVYRVLMSLITTYGSYRAAVALVGWEHKRTFGARMLINIKQWVNGIKNAKTAMQALNATMSSNVLGLFVSALTAAVSYFWLFNNSADEMKEKLKEIQETFASMRSNATDIFVSGLKSDNVNTQIDKLKELVSFAESELGITIPVNVQDVDAESVAQKLRDVKNDIDEYLDFAQAFSETAAGNESLNKYFTEFGNTAQSTFTNIYSSVNTVIEGLQKLADEGHASARDLEILEELVVGKKEDESKLEYLQRLVSLYEELGLIGKKVVTPDIYYARDNMKSLEEQQKKTLDRIKVHNKQVFATMLQDVQDFYSNSSIAEYQLERTVKELAERIDINSIPEDQRTLKLSAAINEEAAKNNWNDFAKQYARQVANTKFGTTIEISDESKKNTEVELKEWQKKLQSWADANGITLGITLNFDTTEVDAAKEALQNAQKAQELLSVRQRKQKVGLATQAEVDAAKQAYDEARLVAKQAGADLSSLNRKGGSGGSKKDNVLDALKDEISLVKKLQSEYDKLTKSGVMSADAIVAMQDAYGSTLRLLNKDLQKFGLPRIELSNILGKNPHEILAVFTELRNILESKGLSNLERMKVVEGVIEEWKVSAKNYDVKKVTEGLNSELGKLKDEYELSLELDANPELGDMFADMFGIDTTDFPRTIDTYMQKVQEKFDKARIGLKLSESLNIFTANTEQWYNWGKAVNYSEEQVDNFKKSFDGAVGVAKKWAQDTIKQTQDLQYELADNNGRIAIEEQKLANLRQRLAQETNDKQKELLELQIQKQHNAIAKLKEEVLQLLPTYMNLFNSIAEHSASVTRRLAKQWKDALHDAVLNMDGTYTITDPLSGEKATVTAKQYGTQIGKVNDKLRETETSWQKIKEAFTKKDEDGIVDWQQGLALVGDEISNIANSLQELSSILEDVGVKFSDDINYAIEGLSQVGSGVSEFARGLASSNWIQAAVGGVKAVVGLGKTAAGIFGGTKKDYFTELNNSLQGLLDTLNKVADYQLESLGKMTGSKAASEYRKMIENNEMAIKSYRDLAEARGRSGSSWGSHSYAYRTNRELKNDWNEISKYAGKTVTSIQDMYNLSPENLKEIMTNMPVQWSKIDEEIRKALESIIEYGDKANEYTEALGVAMTNMSLDDLVNDFERMLQDMDSDAEDFSENFEEYMRNAIIRSMMVGTYAKELENWYTNFKNRIADDQLSDSDIAALREEYMGIVNRALTERDRLLSVMGTSASSGNLSALQQGIQSVSEDTASALEAYMNGVSQQVYLQSDLLTQIRDAVVGMDMDVQLGVFSQMLLQLQQSYIVQQNIQNLLQNVINPSGRAFMVELAS